MRKGVFSGSAILAGWARRGLQEREYFTRFAIEEKRFSERGDGNHDYSSKKKTRRFDEQKISMLGGGHKIVTKVLKILSSYDLKE